jgi:O-succinylhomoserine sulfhydrylase
VLNRLRLITISNNLGDTKSLITHPATTTHERFSAAERARLGIGEDLLRLSVGLEDPADLIADLDQALPAATLPAARAAAPIDGCILAADVAE